MSDEWDTKSDQEREGQAFGSGFEAGYEAAREQWEATRDTFETAGSSEGGGYEGGGYGGGVDTATDDWQARPGLFAGAFPGLADWGQTDTETESKPDEDLSSDRQELMDERAELLEQREALLEQKEDLLEEREKFLEERADAADKVDNEEDGQGGRRPRLRIPRPQDASSSDNEPRRRRR